MKKEEEEAEGGEERGSDPPVVWWDEKEVGARVGPWERTKQASCAKSSVRKLMLMQQLVRV